ncbi:hypothetical protein AB6D34_08860 [Pectobacterium brasiliense]|uniref:Uncharacterized protein n=2 Tax=Pectobacterium brasiliense TaxID=180957 RepID=A0A433NJ34_9GAMM|nr:MULTISPECIES: hypothetical protein [Pectobacterium]GKW27879.1 hypothetical protein PEC331060_10570 [Pectobacterium carotovorum subsp. carotovorum]MBN3046618.1 hypothetical protein [Pectobacterium brasiliense]MBN3075249.1 hypothetical protein [Pectobacterium brasiliense]MBN3083625.1 hypothetical protein [Pectobacterium brasiliense]MBN3089165.1 hypothetical protein [Pectobacterium brasiliense]
MNTHNSNNQIKRTDTTQSKVKTVDDLKTHMVDANGQKVPNSVWGTDASRSEVVSMSDSTGGILNVGYTDRSGRPQPFGNDVHDYIQALEASLEATFNDGDFADAMQQHIFPSEFRPFASLPTPLNVQLLEDRTVTFNPSGKLDRSNLPTAKAIAGSAVMVAPVLHGDDNTQTGILCSTATHVSDFDMMGGWTDGSLRQTVANMQLQFCRIMAGNVAKVLSKTPDLVTFECEALSSKPKDAAEDLLDYLAINLPVHLGATLDAYALMVPEKLEAVLERAAQRAGHEDASELFGCTIMGYLGEDTGVYLLPKGFAMLSFRSTKEGDTVKVIVTRDPNRAGYDVELITVIDVMATGSVKVKQGEFNVEATAEFPVVHRLTFKSA